MQLKGEETLRQLDKEELVALVADMAKRWLAHDGIWFLCVENKRGLDEAIELDGQAWERFAAAEAVRIMKVHNVPANGGLPALEQALKLRAYSFINTIEIVESSPEKLVFKMVTCRVQAARRRKGLPNFDCKPVGIIEYNSFAKTIDPRIQVRCVACHPDDIPIDEYNCIWEFTI